MLVLSRKVGQRIVIGNNVTITIVAIHGDRVRLGFEAPGSVPIHREEIQRRIQSEEKLRTSCRVANVSSQLASPLHAESA